MDTLDQARVNLVANFIDTTAPTFHPAFGVSSRLDMAQMQYDSNDIADLKETLEFHRKAGKFVDFTSDIQNCTWEDVHRELVKAQEAAERSVKGGKQLHRKLWRTIGSTSSVLAPGLAAMPDYLCVLHGGLALVFSLARHSELNRLRILGAFEMVPNIIEMAENKAAAFPLDERNPKTIKLHESTHQLRLTLLRALPALIQKLVPSSSFKNWCKGPFGAMKIDKLLDEVKACAESVRVCAEGLIEEVIVNNYAATKTIQTQLDDLYQLNREMLLSVNASNSQTQLLHFLMEQLSLSPGPLGYLTTGRDPADMSDMGTALPGFTPEDLLRHMDVNHLRTGKDSAMVTRRGPSFSPEDTERAMHMTVIPQVAMLMNSTQEASIVAVDGHFDRSQMGKISPLSYMCSMLSRAIRQKPQEYVPTSPASPHSEIPASRKIVLEFYCSLHTAEDDDLCGPQGLMRCLVTQLILFLLANGWLGQEEAVNLPYLRNSAEEDMLMQRRLEAVCRLFLELTRHVPQGVPIYCFIDGWSAYEREDPWRADYDVVIETLREASSVESRGNLKLLLTSPTTSRWLTDILPREQRVSLRGREGGGRHWRGAGGGSLLHVARATTLPHAGGGLGTGFSVYEHVQVSMEEHHDKRPSS